MVKHLFSNGHLSILLGHLIYPVFYGATNEASGLYYKYVKYVHLFTDISIYKSTNYHDTTLCSEKCILKRTERMNYMEFLVQLLF